MDPFGAVCVVFHGKAKRTQQGNLLHVNPLLTALEFMLSQHVHGKRMSWGGNLATILARKGNPLQMFGLNVISNACRCAFFSANIADRGSLASIWNSLLASAHHRFHLPTQFCQIFGQIWSLGGKFDFLVVFEIFVTFLKLSCSQMCNGGLLLYRHNLVSWWFNSWNKACKTPGRNTSKILPC